MNTRDHAQILPSRDREGAESNSGGFIANRSLAVAARYGKDHARQRSGFTLVELVVVLAIVSLLAAISLPNINRMLGDTRRADAENRIQGLLRSARMRALHRTESGLFFYVKDNVQRIAFIEAEPLNMIPSEDGQPAPDWGADELRDGEPGSANDDVARQDTANRFRVLQDTVYELPAPFRAVPRIVPFEDTWEVAELSNENYRERPQGSTGVENHRNFFTILFSPDGVIRVGRQVFIHDHTEPNSNNDPTYGDITGLEVDFAHRYQDGADTVDGVSPFTTNRPLPMMIINDAEVDIQAALTFPSVDGVLIYDDELFRDQPDTGGAGVVTKREFLKLYARPLYISHQTGAIIRGPIGETALAD